MTRPIYDTPEAFKQALETRLRRRALQNRGDLVRVRQLFVFDRFLARVALALGDRVVIKGGVVLELRLERARTTRDVDLWVQGKAEEILDELQRAGKRDLGDYLTFLLVPDTKHPRLEGHGIAYAGRRFRAEARLAGKLYGMPFGVDAGIGDVMSEMPDVIVGSSFLDFVNVAPARLRVYPRETHLAEKLHAYTIPRPRENSRVKDLPDMALLAQTGQFDGLRLRRAFDQTFHFRKSHPLPPRLPEPPARWTSEYANMARTDGLSWTTIAELLAAVRAFIDPVLVGGAGTWDAAEWKWGDA